ncbi:conserved hypothetical protein [Verticillium alfalfae VaMs.102]|uniref:DUF3433 domain-containing protein n=1 Tax=Verticillium alfalfae (strain VaMs.102 / ATCC MYA-4576 / FGSC 10136) TaxID=526221 RepID=C9SFR0_VERA1|nr:conserved hypothetical protein [Verticillium alfalfae VaMs.102]EEY18005.1 conserved hypothetical protein [Verticillium alfalfae VaMs.102]
MFWTSKRPVVALTEVSSYDKDSRNTSPAEETTPSGRTESRKSSFPWTLEKTDSECSLVGEHKHGWKPMSMRAQTLLPFTIISALIAIGTELLAVQSNREGGLALVHQPEDNTAATNFAYLFLPTIVAVFYSMIWSWVDLDVKRIQPWLELSATNGATGKDSLFSEYPYNFIGFVPFSAAKRRFQWAITSSFLPASNQSVLLDQSIMNVGFATTWLGQPLLPFTTPDYTLLPFKASQSPDTGGPAANWTGTTTKLTTELECWPAAISDSPIYGAYHFNNGRGCNASTIVPYNSHAGKYPFRLLYIGYHNDAHADYFLAGPTCSRNTSNQFLAIWSAFVEVGKTNVTAVFCEATYYKQKVSATVSGPRSIPIEDSIIPLGPRETLLDTEFNHTGLHYLLGSGVSAVATDRDWYAHHFLEQYTRLYDTGFSLPASPMVGFAVGSDPSKPAKDYGNHTALGQAFVAPQKMLFHLAVNKVLADADDVAPTNGAATYFMHGFIVSRPISIVVETLLLLVGAMSLALLWCIQAKESKLLGEPGSVSALIQVIRKSPELLNEFSGQGSTPEEKLRNEFEDERFRLCCGCDSASGATELKVLGSGDRPDRILSLFRPSAGHYEPVEPLALRTCSGIAFIMALLAMLAGLTYLKVKEEALGVLATLIEPFWVLVNRLLCVLQPFKDLFEGRSTSRGSVDATYTSIPPQLVVWRALRARHYMLAIVCIMALLCDVLAVGLGGLFNEGPTRSEYSIQFKHDAAPRLSNGSLTTFANMLRMPYPYEEHFYVTSANITLNTTLPPWTSTEYFFQPFSAYQAGGKNTTEILRGRTRGYGIDPQCETATSNTQPPSVDLTDFKDKHSIAKSLGCTDVYQPEYLRLNESTAPPQGPSSVESPDTFLSGRLAEPCAKTFIMGWGRTSNGSDANGTVESGFVLCYPRFRTALFDVTINTEGHVLEYEKASEMEYGLGYPGFTNQTDNLIIVSNNIIAKAEGRWHNHTFTRDWMSELIRLETNSSDFVDPLQPLPSPETMLNHVGPMYTRLFALFLGLNSFIFDNDTSAEPAFEGQRWARETRIFMSEPAFIVSTTILSLSLVVAAVLYGWSIVFFLPRMPTNIASVLAYVAASTAVRECSPKQYESPTFSFGRYIGVDGRAHVGIDADPSVVPIQLESLRKGNTNPRRSWLGRLRKRHIGEHGAGDTWL